ncbi:vacuolar H+ ATPase V1 sector, subunit C [Dunaliella salina]|uniref:V-type proton ATPase subunit C n=1 Tax=Dunaliella salina TaxID=3046 RepID=A0ABQ7GL69_DUNSA|nr:vacuolar H+ ATPase V1 sector, subunit C [Dunaliella salina]|eukprot:KAF5835347.1 vacuolar H+ ATPase V1 sector, subunit C [Dunaliella salina]
MPQAYWLVSLPLANARRKEAVWEVLQECTASNGLSQNSKLEVPELRVGTLDSLMALSDDLAKTCHSVEAVVSKARRQVHDTAGAEAASSLKVEGLPSEVFLTRFRWDEAKFPARRPLRDTVEKMGEITARIEDELKVKISEYTVLKSTLGAASRKHAGNLSVRDISSLVKPQHLVDSENLYTLFVVVSKYALPEWWQMYEKLSNFVVPRSSRIVAEDNDYTLVTVVLFKRVVDEFKASARSKGYQVREYVPASESGMCEVLLWKPGAGLLMARCGRAFSVWVHMCVVRLFVESILRYGLPPNFQAAVIHPTDKKESKLRQVLAEAFGDGRSALWKGEDGAAPAGAGLLADTEFHPYVSLTMNVETM